ncbi:MAG: hypothetical protein ACC742_11320 [Thermoanaerobaculales bacterium]
MAAARSSLEGGTTNEHGIIHWQDRESLSLFVSGPSVDRSLPIMDTLIGGLGGAGFAVEVETTLDGEGHPTGHTTSAMIYGERIPFHIAEEIDPKERAPTYEERMEMRQS